MHLCVHRWLHGVWLAAVLVLERVCVALPLLVKGIVRFRQAQVRLLLGQLYIKENPARVALNSPLLILLYVVMGNERECSRSFFFEL